MQSKKGKDGSNIDVMDEVFRYLEKTMEVMEAVGERINEVMAKIQ